MREKVEKAFWRFEAELLAPSRSLKAFRASLTSLLSTIEEILSEGKNLNQHDKDIIREELAQLRELCLSLRRCRWRSALTRGWAFKHLPSILSSKPQMNEVGCEGGQDDVEGLIKRQAEGSCAEGPSSLLLAIRSRCLLVTAVAALLVFAQANITGPPFSPASETEKLEIKHEEEGRQKHPDLYAPKPTAGAAAAAAAGAAAGAAAAAAAAAADGVCCCCCSYCGFCPRDEAISATAAAAAKGVLRQRHCYCEFEIEKDSQLLGSPMQTATETAKRIPAVAAILSIDGELAAGAPRVFPRAPQNTPAAAASAAAAEAAAAAAAADDMSGSLRASVAPSLVETVLFDFAAVLQQLHLLPEGFSCTSSEAVDMERLLEAADFGSFAINANSQEIKKFKKDVAGLVVNRKDRFCLIPPLPAATATATAAAAAAAAATAATAAATATAAAAAADCQTMTGTARLLVRHALEDSTAVDFAALLPDPQWMTARDKTLLLLELALRLAVFGRVEISDAVNNMACDCFGVEFVLTGAPGIRRKYQTEALPQLVVSAAVKKMEGLSINAKQEGGPQPHTGAPLAAAKTSPAAASPESNSSSSSSSSASRDSSSKGTSSVVGDKDTCSSSSNSSSSSSSNSSSSNSSSNSNSNSSNSSSSSEGEKQSQQTSDGGEETCATEGASSDSEESPAESKRRLWRLEDVREDTDIMERPALAKGVDWETFERPLGVTEQALLLAKSRAIIESSPCNDPLALEEVGAVVSRALVLPPSGSTAATSSSSSSSTREYFKRRHSFLLSQPPEDFTEEPAYADPPACYRLFGLLFHADLLSWWELHREVAVRMMRIGATITAAEKFTQLKMWEEAADCLIAADRRADARAILEQQIAERPTPHLLCALGDLEKQENPDRAEQLFKQAWELSGGRYARAQRALGFFFFRRQRLAEAAASLRLATAANTLHAQSWFALGCCCMQLGEDLEARAAFARVVAIDPQEGDAWANLAAVHCKREAWAAAQQCITEAAKHKRDSWRVWQTFISICVKTRDVQAIGRGLRMLVDINAVRVYTHTFADDGVVAAAIAAVVAPGPAAVAAVAAAAVAAAAIAAVAALSGWRLMVKSRIDPWIYSVLEELVCYQLKQQQEGSHEDQRRAIEQGLLPGVLRQTLSCLQYLTQHISDSPELFRVYGVLLVKAQRHGDAVYSWLKEFRTLQAALTRGDSSPRSRREMAERQVTALERAVSLLSAFSADSANRNDLLQQLRTTVETHEKRIDEEATEVRERLESLQKRISTLQQQIPANDVSLHSKPQD
ncbi:hypothetical protein Emed_000661 [Eimeria media]